MVSYRKRHIKSRINNIKPRKPIYKRLWFWLSILLFTIISTVSYFLLFYSEVQVKNIIISGNQKISTQEINGHILQDIKNEFINLWGLKISSTSIFLVNTKKINENLLKIYPVLDKIEVKKDYFQNIFINITEKKPLGIYCNSFKECFYIDQNGIIFERIIDLPEDVLVIKQADGNEKLEIGNIVISKNIIVSISNIKENLISNFNISLNTANLNISQRLNTTTNEGWQIYFDLSSGSDLNHQIIKLNSLINKNFSDISLRKNLKYIDLRPTDRAIVCDNDICGN